MCLKIIRAFALTLMLLPLSAQAEVPFVGLWGVEGCEDYENIQYQGHTLLAYFADGHFKIVALEVTPADKGKWHLVRTDPLDKTPALRRLEEDQILTAQPLRKPEAEEEITSLHEALASGVLNPDESMELFHIHRSKACASLPLPQSLFLGEVWAVLADLDAAVWSCRSALETCANVFFDIADVSGDKELSVAEMSRAIRASMAIVVAFDTEVSDTQASATAAASTALAPVASAAFLYSFDYDRSGALSFEEILGDRLPPSFTMNSGVGSELPDLSRLVSEIVRAAASASAMMMK